MGRAASAILEYVRPQREIVCAERVNHQSTSTIEHLDAALPHSMRLVLIPRLMRLQ